MMVTPAAIIAHLDAISRRRALTLGESLQLERAIRQDMIERQPPKRRRTDHWRPEEDSRLRSLREDGLSYRLISESGLRRTANAVASRLRYLGLKEAAR